LSTAMGAFTGALFTDRLKTIGVFDQPGRLRALVGQRFRREVVAQLEI